MALRAFILFILFLSCLATSCSSDNGASGAPEDVTDPGTELYIPPAGISKWETVTPAELNWNTAAEQPLYDFLEEKKSKAFLILKEGRIAEEFYFGSFTKDSLWYWASAGKTLTSFMVGIAQEQGLLNLSNKTSDFLGTGWTSAPSEKEDLITIWHQLTMTSGLKDSAFDCVTSDCLEYMADAGTRWAYHNGPYTLLQKVVSAAANSTYAAYFNTHLRDKIGMNGFWLSTNGLNNVYFSNARSMARFGLLALNDGRWGDTIVLGDSDYLTAIRNSSQALNPSYGYLWWLNGKDPFMVPGLQLSFQGPLIPEAPADTYAGLGKNDQKLYVVPSKGLVIVRMGEDTGELLLGPSSFDNALWEKIDALIN